MGAVNHAAVRGSTVALATKPASSVDVAYRAASTARMLVQCKSG